MSKELSLPSMAVSGDDPTCLIKSSDRAEASAQSSALTERAYWKRYFADDNLADNEVHVLQKEGQQLASTLTKAFPNDTRATWTIERLQDAVARSQQTWEAKERLGKGKPQKLFHKLMQKFDTHSHLFEVIPQGDLYTSLITGGAMIIVKASVNHSKTIEELSNAMDTIGEAIGRCSIDSQLIRSTLVQDAVAKLYIEVFKFLGEVALWYNSSSTSKLLNSLHRDFSERFRGSIDAIKEQADRVQQVAQIGTQAEVRVARLHIEELSANLGRAHVGLSDDLTALIANLRRWDEESLRQHDATRDMLRKLLPQLNQQITPGELLLENSSTDANILAIDRQPFESWSHPLPARVLSIPAKQLRVQVNAMLGWTSEAYLDTNMSPGRRLFRPQFLQPINQWLAATSTPLMYVEYQSSVEPPDTVFAAAECVAKALRSRGVPCVSQYPSSMRGDVQNDVLKRLSLELISGMLGLLDGSQDMYSPAWEGLNSATKLSDVSFAHICQILTEVCSSVKEGVHVILAAGRSSLGKLDPMECQEFWRVLRHAVDTNGFRVLFLAQCRVESFIKTLRPEEVKMMLAPARSQVALAPIVVPSLKDS